jgi:hypothetical protein
MNLTVLALALGTGAQRDDDGRVARHRCCFQSRLGVEAESSIHMT